jgi:hypothetical protein
MQTNVDPASSAPALRPLHSSTPATSRTPARLTPNSVVSLLVLALVAVLVGLIILPN